jgi:predicted NUDIX family NTP pyrophosphohydrolase
VRPRHSAGLLLWRRTPAGPELLLGHPGGPLFTRKDDGVWSIPKGEIDPDEDPETAARREFAEELGLVVPDGPSTGLGSIRMKSGKVVSVWALEGDLDVTEIRSNLFSMEWPPHSGRHQEFVELDRAGWFTPAHARVKLTPSQLPFVDRLVAHAG